MTKLIINSFYARQFSIKVSLLSSALLSWTALNLKLVEKIIDNELRNI